MPESMKDASIAWISAQPLEAFAGPIWWPAHALLGDGAAALSVTFVGFAIVVAGLWLLAGPFVRATAVLAGASEDGPVRRGRIIDPFRAVGFRSLISKERKLILRDPWLLSQILMQCLFLLPLSLVVLRQHWSGEGDVTLFVPILTILSGQIAGGLTWIALSADDAPDLMATAPMQARVIRQAKLLTVGYLTMIFVTVPLILVLWYEPYTGLTALGGMVCGALCAVAINLWHQPVATRREMNRRRSRSSTLVNFMEIVILLLVAATLWFVVRGEGMVAVVPGAIAGAALITLRMWRRPRLGV